MTSARKWPNTTTAALMCCWLGMLIACDQRTSHAPRASPLPSVTVAKPIIKDIVEWNEFVGRYDAVDAVDVRARVGGYLQSIHFKDGAMINKGDLLFVIDPRPFKATVDATAGAVTGAEARLVFAQAELRRIEPLARSGATPGRLLDGGTRPGAQGRSLPEIR